MNAAKDLSLVRVLLVYGCLVLAPRLKESAGFSSTVLCCFNLWFLLHVMVIYSVITNILWDSNYYILDTLKDSHETWYDAFAWPQLL